MKRLFVLLFAFLLSSAALNAQFANRSYSDLDDSEMVRTFKEHISYLSSPTKEGRAPGSDGEKEAAIYVTDALRKYGVDVLSGDNGEVFGIKKDETDTLTSRNVIGFIPGYDKNLKGHYIVIGARMDNSGVRKMIMEGKEITSICYGANANASGVAMLLELAKRLQNNSVLLRRSVILMAFGASQISNAGSWYFLNRSFEDVGNIDAMINLDALGSGSENFLAYTSANIDLNSLIGTLNSTLQPVKPKLTTVEPFSSDHRSFYEKEIPSILFSTGSFSEMGSPRDTEDRINYDDMERELEYIYNFSISLVNGTKPAFGTQTLTKKSGEPIVVSYYDCDRKPAFLAKTDPKVFLEEWVYRYLKYPEGAVRNGIQGKVLVDFIVDEKGNVTNVKVLKGVHELLDDEAVRVISASPRWKPGLYRGVTVRTELSLWVEFILERRK